MCCKRQNRKRGRKCRCPVVNHGKQGEQLSNSMAKVFLDGFIVDAPESLFTHVTVQIFSPQADHNVAAM